MRALHLRVSSSAHPVYPQFPFRCATLQCCCTSCCQNVKPLTVRQLVQIKTGPVPERLHAVHLSNTSLGSMRKRMTASLEPAIAARMADSAHDHEASAQSAAHMTSGVPEQASASRLPPSQARSWRQLILQPLYPERLPAVCQGQGDASIAPDPAHTTARKQDCTPAGSGLSYSHCSASPRKELSSCDSRAAVKGRPWSADLYKELLGRSGSSNAALQAPVSHDAPVLQGGGARASVAQHAKRTGSAPLRCKTSLRQASVGRIPQAARGKENDKPQVQPQAQYRHVVEQIQTRTSHQQSLPQRGTAKNKTPANGSPPSVQTSSPFTPRLGARGKLNMDIH